MTFHMVWGSFICILCEGGGGGDVWPPETIKVNWETQERSRRRVWWRCLGSPELIGDPLGGTPLKKGGKEEKEEVIFLVVAAAAKKKLK